MHKPIINEELLDKTLKEKIFEGFKEHAIAASGSDGNMKELTFTARDGKELLGAIHVKTFWGALHIKYLFVSPHARGSGLGRALIDRALQQGKQMGCRFAYVETMSFQAVDFYKKLGFIEELVRHGFDNGASFHYLKKDFD